MSGTMVIALPAAPEPGQAELHWWRVREEAVIEAGVGEGWRAPGLPLVALAPVAAVRLHVAEPAGATEKQRLGVARAAALEASLAAPDTLHAVSALDGLAVVTAVAANSVMLDWLDWLKGLGEDPVAVVPAALLLPRGPEWRAAMVGSEAIVGRGELVFPHEPALTEALVGAEEVAEVPPEELEAGISRLAEAPFLNLRTGRFARRRLLLLDWARVRELAVLAAAIPIIGLVMALVMIARLNGDSDRLDAEAAALASEAVARPVTAQTAGAELDARIGQSAGAAGSPFAALAALYQQLQLAPAVSPSTLNWRGDGTLATTLAAPRAEELNRVLVALQGAGFRVTAVPRQAPDGRTMADITLRTAP